MTGSEFRNSFLVHADCFYRVAIYIMESREEAEDAVQELFIRLWKARENLSAVKNPRAYGITMVKNICLDRMRSLEYRGRGGFPDGMVSEDSPDNRLADRERLDEVKRAIGELPPREREVLVMKVFDGLTYEEISERTGLSNLSLRVLLSNARRRIRRFRGQS